MLDSGTNGIGFGLSKSSTGTYTSYLSFYYDCIIGSTGATGLPVFYIPYRTTG